MFVFLGALKTAWFFLVFLTWFVLCSWFCALVCLLVLQELQSDGGSEEDLGGEPLTWTESLGSGGPLLYSSLLRWQASALQVNIRVWVCCRCCF